MPSTVKNSLRLVKDLHLNNEAAGPLDDPDVAHKHIRILERDVRRQNRCPTSSLLTPAILACIKKLERGSFLIFRSMDIGKGCHLYLHKHLMERLCAILREPTLLLRFKTRSTSPSRGRSTGAVFEIRLRLAEALKNVGNDNFTDWYKMSGKYPASESRDKYVTSDLILGWSETCKSNQINTGSYLASSLQNIFLEERSKDLTLVAGNGSEIRCHKMIFEAHSDILAAMVSPHNGMVEFKTGRVQLKENSEEGLNRLIRYFYGMELTTEDLTCDVTVELLLTAHMFMLPELASSLIKFIWGRNGEWFTWDGLLELHFHAKNLEEESKEWAKMANHALLRMSRLTSDIMSCEAFQELCQADPGAATQLCEKLAKLSMEQGARVPAKRKWEGK